MRIQIPLKPITNDKAKISAIAFTLLLCISAMISIIPATFGYTAMPDRDTGTVVSASPTRIGLGQQVLINIFTYPAPAGPTAYAQDLVTKFDGLDNVWVSITKPDGTTDTYMPVDSTLANIGINKPGHAQIVGSLMFYYTPDQIGNYSISGEFKGDTYLRAVDTDGNVYDIGTTTSDQTGFKFAWTPPKAGLYTVTATFDGSVSYWGSWSGTALNVAEAAQQQARPQQYH